MNDRNEYGELDAIAAEESSRRQLLFATPVLHAGLNVTVRNGPKWLSADMGEGVDLFNIDAEGLADSQVGTAVVLAVHSAGRLEDIPREVIHHHHDPACRNLGGLMRAMEACYGADHGDEGYTVVFFWV